MDCRNASGRLGRYLDNELPPEERDLVETHLFACQRCGEELATLRGVSKALQSVAVPPVPEQLAAKVMERAARERASATSPFQDIFRFWSNWSLQMRLAAGAVTLAACFLGLIIGGSSLSSPSAAQRGDELRWVGLSSRGPIATAYIERSR